MLPTPYAAFRNDLRGRIPDGRVYTDALRTLAYGTDASCYRLIPKIVVDVETEDEVTEVLRLAGKHGTPVTFRAAGTSLCGQGVTDSVLMRLACGWRGYRVGKDAERITLQPGIIGAEANAILAPFGKKIGPDPASIDTCKIGGIAANNSSGMCCGVTDNSYKTLVSSRLILADGTLLDTGDAASRKAFAETHGALLRGLEALRAKVIADAELTERIRKKYKIKNTTGYSINALVDFEDPFAILEHLMIGSEGTLGFIAEVTYKTVEELPFKASSLMLFTTIPEACRAAMLLMDQPVSSAEVMDRASLRSVEGQPGIPGDIAELGDEVCSLLVETRAANKKDLEKQMAQIAQAVSSLALVKPVAFTDVETEYAALWKIRKGIIPSVGALRTPGETCLIEDIAVPPEHLADAALTLQKLFAKHEYREGVIFGHALDGNLHFLFNQNFEDPKEIQRFADFMDDVCTAIAVTYDGSLKAEHGTGRNVAPFVELEWGKTAYALMGEIKALFDPQGILNPGVLLNSDKNAHITHLKPLTPAHELIDACTECGFCEPTCPSRRLSLTPRQRITTWRQIMRLKDPRYKDKMLRALEKTYTYQGRDTCAADGLCSLRCPTGIDTGKFIKDLRARQHGFVSKKTAAYIGGHFRAACTGASVLLRSVNLAHKILGTRLTRIGANAVRVASMRAIPAWNAAMPTAAASLPRLAAAAGGEKTVVYFPSCISRAMGPDLASIDRRSEVRITIDVLTRAGFQVVFPDNLADLCCGMAFSSKGFTGEAAAKAAQLEAALLKATDNGRFPVLSETSPCLLQMRETLDSRLKLYEPIAFALEFLAPALRFTVLPKKVAVHATCSARKMGLTQKLVELAGLCAETVVLPQGVECCGFAGDRGFTHPELNEAALHDLRRQVGGCDAGYSTSRTCQIGLTVHGGIPYMSILALVDEATRA